MVLELSPDLGAQPACILGFPVVWVRWVSPSHALQPLLCYLALAGTHVLWWLVLHGRML